MARNILVGCGVVAVLAVGAFAAFVYYVRSNPASITDLMMKQIESHYGPDVTADQKRDLRAAYADFRKAITEHRVRPEAAQKIQVTFSSGSSRELTAEQVRELAAEFRQAAATGRETAPATPPAATLPSATPSP
jgi:uncharacterized membrane protein